MKKYIKFILMASLISLPGIAALKQSDTAPDFKLRASLGGKEFSFSLSEQLKKGPVVVYFYPSAYTGGCNVQAHEFSVNSEKFAAAGASIVGVSLDSIERLNQFSKDPEFCASKFPVASDADGKVAKSFDLSVGAASAGAKDTRGIEIGHGFAERTTFVITPDGKVAATIGGMSSPENVKKSLEAVQALGGEK